MQTTTVITATDAKQIFKRAIKGSNVVAPRIIRYGVSGDHVYELAKGKDIARNTMYGVTVVDARTEEHNTELSSCFYSLHRAEWYIRTLRKPKEVNNVNS